MFEEDSRSPHRDLNAEPPKYEEGVLIIRLHLPFYTFQVKTLEIRFN